MAATGFLGSAFVLVTIFWPTLFNEAYLADDLANFAIPFRQFYAEGLRAGRIDIWCPSLLSGYYMHGEGQMGMFHPLHLLLYRFVPLIQAFGFELMLIYIALGAGSYLLFREWGTGRLGAGFGSFLFSLGGTNLLNIVHINEIGIAAHIPWMMLVIWRYFRSESHRPVWLVALALLNGSALLLGHPFYYLMAVALQVWSTLYFANGRAWCKAGLQLAVAGAFGILIGAVQWLPTWTVLKASERASPSFAFLSAGSLNPWNFMQWVNPYVFLNRKYGEYGLHELGIYLGIGPLLLFAWLWSVRNHGDKRLVIFLVGLATLGVFLSLGHYNFLWFGYVRLPLFKLFRVSARYMLFTNFAVAGGAALAVDRLRTTPAQRPQVWIRPLLVGLFVCSLLTVVLKGLSVATTSDYRTALAHPAEVLVGCTFACTGIVLFWFALHYRAVGLTAFWAFSIFDISFYSATYLMHLPKDGLQYFAAGKPPVPPPGPLFVPDNDSLMLGGYSLASGYVGLAPRTSLPRTHPLYLQAAGVTAILSTKNQWTLLKKTVMPVRLARPFVSDHAAEGMAQIDLATTAVVNARVDVDNDATGWVRIGEQRPGLVRIVSETSGRALCVLTQRFDSGWTAEIGNRPLELVRVNGDFTGFIVPAGHQEVTLQFLPQDFARGCAITLGALTVIAMTFIAHLIPGVRKK